MKRRTVLAGLGSAFASPLAARAQPAGRVFRVGLVFTTTPVSEMTGPDPIIPSARSFVHALRNQGYVERQNLILEHRSAGGKFDKFDEIMAELVGLKVDVIVTSSDEVTRAATRVTKVIPIVMAFSYDPVGAGLVASLAFPGGNVTGVTGNAGSEIEGKKLQILKELVPEATRVAFLGTSTDWNGPMATYVRSGARKMGMLLTHAEVTPNNYADAFALITQDRPHAVFLAAHPTHYANRQIIAEFMVKHCIPCIFSSPDYVKVGGLISYGVNTADLYRRAAGYVVRILNGAKPADLPVEQPTKLEMAVNLKTAKICGLMMPTTLLAMAGEVIE